MGPAGRRMQTLHDTEKTNGMSAGKRWALRIFLFLIIVGSSAAGMFFAYTQGLEDGVKFEPPLVVAETAPIKVKPDDPGGKKAPHEDKLVYEQLSGQNIDAQDATLAPEAEQMTERPTAPEVEIAPEDLPEIIENNATVQIAEARDEGALEASSGEAPSGDAPSSAPDGAPIPLITGSSEDLSGMVPQDSPTASSVNPSEQPSGVTVATVPAPEPAPEPTPEPEVAPETEPEPSKPVAASGGPFFAQLGSFRSQEAAAQEWQRLSTKYPADLSAYSHRFHTVDLGDKGTYHRLLVGGFAGVTEAKSVCTMMENKKERCLVNRID